MLKFVLIERPNNEAEIRLFNVEMHCDLVRNGEKCLGGGFWKFDDDKKQIVMWDKSFDFGYPKFEGKKIICYDEDWEDFEFYYVYDLFMPRDEESKINIEVR